MEEKKKKKEQEEDAGGAGGGMFPRQLFCADLSHPYFREAHRRDGAGDGTEVACFALICVFIRRR